MLSFDGLNLWAVLTATVVAFVLGGLWYGPLFGRAWLAAVGKTEEDLKGGSSTPFVLSFFTAGATSLLLAMLIGALGVESLADGATLGLFCGLGFIAASMASDYAFCGWGSKLWVIQAGYRVVYSVLMGAILGAWR